MKDGRFIITQKDFDGEEFKIIMASGDGRRLSVCYRDGSHYFQVECLKSNLGVVFESVSINPAIKKFNSI